MCQINGFICFTCVIVFACPVMSEIKTYYKELYCNDLSALCTDLLTG